MFAQFRSSISSTVPVTIFADGDLNLRCELSFVRSGAPGMLPGSIGSAGLIGEVGRLVGNET
jgi:hypothetical protein